VVALLTRKHQCLFCEIVRSRSSCTPSSTAVWR